MVTNEQPRMTFHEPEKKEKRQQIVRKGIESTSNSRFQWAFNVSMRKKNVATIRTDNRLKTIYHTYPLSAWEKKGASMRSVGSLYKAVDHPRKLRLSYCLVLKSVRLRFLEIFRVDGSFEVASKWENLNNPIRTLQRNSSFSIPSSSCISSCMCVSFSFSLSVFLIQKRIRKKSGSIAKFQSHAPEFSWFDSLLCTKWTDINTKNTRDERVFWCHKRKCTQAIINQRCVCESGAHQMRLLFVTIIVISAVITVSQEWLVFLLLSTLKTMLTFPSDVCVCMCVFVCPTDCRIVRIPKWFEIDIVLTICNKT